MVEVASADVLLGETGLDEVLLALDRFAEGVESSMEQAVVATEKATEVSGSSIVAFAALGAAIGTVFVDFIRQSAVMSTLGTAFGAIFGSIADRILIGLVPAIVKLIPVILDMGDTFVEVSSRIIDDLLPAFEKAIEAAGNVGDAFAGLDEDTQDLTVSIGLLGAGFALIAFGRPVLGASLVLAAFAINLEGIGETITSSGEQLQQLSHDFQQFFLNIVPGLAGDFGGIADAFQTGTDLWGKAFGDFFHDVQTGFAQFGTDTVLGFEDLWGNITATLGPVGEAFSTGAAIWVTKLQDAWGGVVGFFGNLWRNVEVGAKLAWAVISDVFSDAYEGATSIWNTAVTFFGALWTDILAAFAVPFNALLFAVEAVINIFGNFINSTFGLIPGVPNVPGLSLPRLEAGGEVIQSGAAIVHEGEVIINEEVAQLLRDFVQGGRGTGVGLAGVGAPVVTQHFEFNTEYHIAGGIPVGGAAMAAFKRMLDQHSREDAERMMSKLRRRF